MSDQTPPFKLKSGKSYQVRIVPPYKPTIITIPTGAGKAGWHQSHPASSLPTMPRGAYEHVDYSKFDGLIEQEKPISKCPECKGEGKITLFISVKTCKNCGGKGTL